MPLRSQESKPSGIRRVSYSLNKHPLSTHGGITNTVKGSAPGFLGEQCALAEKVGLEEAVDGAHALRRLLVHHRLPLFNDVELVPRVTLQHGRNIRCPAQSIPCQDTRNLLSKRAAPILTLILS